MSDVEDSIGPELPYKVYPIKWDYTSTASYCTCPSSYFNYNNIYIFILLYNDDSRYRCKVATLVGNGNLLQFQYYSGENTINVTGGASGKFSSFESGGYSEFYISGEIANITILTRGGGGNPTYNNDGIIIEIIK